MAGKSSKAHWTVAEEKAQNKKFSQLANHQMTQKVEVAFCSQWMRFALSFSRLYKTALKSVRKPLDP